MVLALKSAIMKVLQKLSPSYRYLTENDPSTRGFLKHLHEIERLSEIRYQDLLLILNKDGKIFPPLNIILESEKSVAHSSLDHLNPGGTIQDDTRSPRFIHACETLIKNKMSVLDLGCAGGGLVLDFTLKGHKAIGLEGSDLSHSAQRATWRILPDRLFTCDITYPFSLKEQQTSELVLFDIITCWEVLEHIPESSLPNLFDNVCRHMKANSYFMGSISMSQDDPRHVTVKPKQWWEDIFKKFGLSFVTPSPLEHYDFPRGTGNGLFDAIDYAKNPEHGFHFIASKNN